MMHFQSFDSQQQNKIITSKMKEDISKMMIMESYYSFKIQSTLKKEQKQLVVRLTVIRSVISRMLRFCLAGWFSSDFFIGILRENN